MKVLNLHCAHGHGFEGWFASSAEFARQQEADLVRCPVCDDARVERLPSARVRVKKGAAPAAATPPPTAAAATDIVAGLPAELIAKLREAVRNTEDVGERFPEEARRIHYKETPARSIRGKASRDEADALADEGIEIAALPPFLTREHQ